MNRGGLGLLVSRCVLVGLYLFAGPLARAEDALASAYQTLRSQAANLAGAPGDIPQRVLVLREIFLDSNGNHAFPLVASHGALWAYGYFERGGRLANIIQYRYFYDEVERERRLRMLDEFTESFKKTNRQVFMDTYTNYYFSKFHGTEPGAAGYIPAELLKQLNAMHAARKQGRYLPQREHRELFVAALLWEQESMVARSVEDAVQRFDCPILKGLALKPVVRFEYFPATKYFLFSDFSDKQERIEHAIESYDLAGQAGWGRVLSALAEYEVPGVE
jgi:hypothetical protein